jgi:hypothetical protein
VLLKKNLRHDIVHHHFICKQLDLVTVVGREQRTFVYEVLMERSDVILCVLVIFLASDVVFDKKKSREARSLLERKSVSESSC